MTYPNGRVLHIGFNSSLDGDLSRPRFLADDNAGSPGTHLAEYTYLALSTIMHVDYTEPHLKMDLRHGSGNDPLDGLDRFSRIVNMLWRDYGASADAERVKHGYDWASNCKYRECPRPPRRIPPSPWMNCTPTTASTN